MEAKIAGPMAQNVQVTDDTLIVELRVRAGVKANYGDDSQQYEMVGGTRTSERKPRTRSLVTA